MAIPRAWPPDANLVGGDPQHDHSRMLQAAWAAATPLDPGLFQRSSATGSRIGTAPKRREQFIRACSPVTSVSSSAPPFP
ncbi:MAG: hypothetical protein ACPGXX_13970 [Planctomycetaceae bacterium]